mmetsp:Transcript_46675/g.109830  ORF Transcript_46675/g.109830 Transcript_46675/m.109830 type:complete len:146 (-) Transcript_46675:7-444(-)
MPGRQLLPRQRSCKEGGRTAPGRPGRPWRGSHNLRSSPLARCLQDKSPEMLKAEQAKDMVVQKLAKVMRKEGATKRGIAELREDAIETSDKAQSDSRSAVWQRSQALATLKAARESEVEDEGRMREERRRWRVAQQQEASLSHRH